MKKYNKKCSMGNSVTCAEYFRTNSAVDSGNVWSQLKSLVKGYNNLTVSQSIKDGTIISVVSSTLFAVNKDELASYADIELSATKTPVYCNDYGSPFNERRVFFRAQVDYSKNWGITHFSFYKTYSTVGLKKIVASVIGLPKTTTSFNLNVVKSNIS